MIHLTCTSCKAALTIDDAFAGGVCRCQHCGTIQTVPSHLKGAAAPGSRPQAVGAAPKTLYEHKPSAPAGGGLDQLADVVASSGLSGSGLRSSHLHQKQSPASPAPAAPALAGKRLPALLLAAGGAMVVLLVGVVCLLFRQSPPSTAVSPGTGGPTARPADGQTTSVQGPSFCGIPLSSSPVIYVLDRGSGTQAAFDAIKEACYSSIESLGPQRQFQVIFWNNGTEVAFPAGFAPTAASRQNLDACRQALQDVYASGSSDARPALEKAMAANPASIVLVTGKGWELDDEFVQMVLKIRGDCPARIHTVSVGSPGTSTALQAIASKTGGEFRSLSISDLHKSLSE